MNRIIEGDALRELKNVASETVQTCVTSPPYFGLRDYGVNEQIGLEGTPEAYVQRLIEVFREVRRVLKKDGTLWLNLGDSYAGRWGAQSRPNGTNNKSTLKGGSMLSARQIAAHPQRTHTGSLKNTPGLKPKDLIGIPWRVAFALQADGWWLRQDIVWHKPNPMPESVRDRCTRSHEFIFMLSKSERYFYDADAIKEPAKYSGIAGMDETGFKDARRFNGKHADKQRGHSRRHEGFNDRWDGMAKAQQCSGMRNKRDVWTVATRPYKEAHFATFPPDLVRPCVLAGSRKGDVVLDPFLGSGTTAAVAVELGRDYIGVELNPAYVRLAEDRIAQAEARLPKSKSFIEELEEHKAERIRFR